MNPGVTTNTGFVSWLTPTNAFLQGGFNVLNNLISTATQESYPEKPSQYLLDIIALTDSQKAQGQTSPIFDNAKDAIEWLNS